MFFVSIHGQSQHCTGNNSAAYCCDTQIHALDFSKGQGLARLGQPVSAPERFHKLVWGSYRTETFMVGPTCLSPVSPGP